MPPRSTKKARITKSQRPTGSPHFNRGQLLDTIEALRVDPNYIPPNIDDPDSDEESWTLVGEFSILGDEEESDDEILEVDEKDMTERQACQEEAAVCEAVTLAQCLWKKILDQVSCFPMTL